MMKDAGFWCFCCWETVRAVAFLIPIPYPYHSVWKLRLRPIEICGLTKTWTNLDEKTAQDFSRWNQNTKRCLRHCGDGGCKTPQRRAEMGGDSAASRPHLLIPLDTQPCSPPTRKWCKKQVGYDDPPVKAVIRSPITCWIVVLATLYHISILYIYIHTHMFYPLISNTVSFSGKFYAIWPVQLYPV